MQPELSAHSLLGRCWQQSATEASTDAQAQARKRPARHTSQNAWMVSQSTSRPVDASRKPITAPERKAAQQCKHQAACPA